MLLALCNCVALGQQEDAKKRVAVLNFDSPSVDPGGPSGLFGADGGDVGKGVSVQLIEKLVQGGKYTVIDRSALEKALKEQSDAASDLADAYALAAQVGRILGLDAMIIGGVTRYGPEEKLKSGGSGILGASVHARKSKAYVEITARVFSVNTGEVIGGFTENGESTASGEITVISTRAHAQASTEMLGNEFVESLLPEATRNAVDRIAARINAFAEQTPRLHVSLEGRVAEVSGSTLTLNVGRKAGAKVGEQLVVVREPAAAADANGTSAAAPSPERIGIATITEVADDSAAATFSGTKRAAVGDGVRDVKIADKLPQ